MELTTLSISPWGKQDHGFQDASSADFVLRLPCCPLWCHDAPNLADIPLGWSKKGEKAPVGQSLQNPNRHDSMMQKKKGGVQNLQTSKSSGRLFDIPPRFPSHVRTKGPATGVCGWMAPYELKSYEKIQINSAVEGKKFLD